MFEGYWDHGIYSAEPNLSNSGFGMMYSTKKYPRGTKVTLNCIAMMPKTDNGFNVGEFSIKSETNLGVQVISNSSSNSQNQTPNQTAIATTPTEIASLKPSFTGLLSLDTGQAIISIVFNSIEDEFGKGYEIKNKILELLKGNRRINEINKNGIDTANIPIRYRLECNTKTFYNPSYSSFSKSTVYTADLRLSLYLWEINKSGRIIKGTPSENKVISTKTFLGGTYISEQGAFDALLPKIEEPLFQKFYSYFPINATLTEITDANKKGEPKKVKISCGINQGVLKNFKFKIIDPARKDEEYDLEVTELFDDYSTCKVKNNESVIATRFNAKDKIGVTTIYKLNKY